MKRARHLHVSLAFAAESPEFHQAQADYTADLYGGIEGCHRVGPARWSLPPQQFKVEGDPTEALFVVEWDVEEPA